MKKFFLVTLSAGVCMLACAQDDVANAKWAAQPVVIDGNANEWHLPLNFYDSETKLLFAMSNDSANIYLCFEAKDEATERQIMRAGMSIELFTKGRVKHDATITYPLAPKDRTQNTDPDNAEATTPAATDNSSGTSTVAASNDGTYRRPDPAIMRQRFLTNNITMNLAGFATATGMTPIRGKAVNVAMNWDNTDDLFYEIAIPLKEFFGDGYTADDVAREITMHVHVNAAESGAPRGGAGDGSGFSGGQGMGGGAMGGGMRGMGGSGGMRGMRGGGMRGGGGGSSQSTAFKQKFVLATSAAANAQ